MAPNPETTRRSLELAVIVPTFNERGNVVPLLAALERSLGGVCHEVIFVDDDSPDGTATLIREIALMNPRVRVLQRVGRRGLASACLEGMMATPAPYVAVMDGDLQHDEGILPAMLDKIRNDKLDLVVATRNAEGGGMGEFSAGRVRLSNLGRRLSQWVSHTALSDPMSGFFMLDRRFLDEVVHSASGVGFKILLDVVASASRPVRFGEVPYTFRKRIHGTSKLDILVGIEYLQLLLDKAVGNLIPPRFIIFSMVGAGGLLLSLSLTLPFALGRKGAVPGSSGDHNIRRHDGKFLRQQQYDLSRSPATWQSAGGGAGDFLRRLLCWGGYQSACRRVHQRCRFLPLPCRRLRVMRGGSLELCGYIHHYLEASSRITGLGFASNEGLAQFATWRMMFGNERG